MKKLVYILLLLGGVILGWTDAWAKNNDFQLWTELKYTHPFKGSKFSLKWAEENRFENNASRFFLFNTTIGFDYQAFKWFRVGFYYRFEKHRGENSENRIFPQVEFLAHLGPFFLEDRNRFENRIFSDGNYRFRYRNRLKLSHTFKTSPVSFTPFASDEIMFETEKPHPFVQNRFTVGNTFGFCKDRMTFDLYYLLRRDRNQDKPGWESKNILGTSLGFKY